VSNSRLQIEGVLASPQVVAASVKLSGLKIASQGQLPQARQLAADRIGGEVASLECLRKLQTLTGSAILVFVEGSEVTGALGVLQLTPAGHAALLGGALDLAGTQGGHVARPGKAATALYAMGIASATPNAARAVVTGVADLRAAFAHLPFYARAVTAAGRRVLRERMDCVPIPGSELLWSAPLNRLGAAA
jgi:hypothetical protein